MSLSSRRRFLVNASKALGGLALVQATSRLGFAVPAIPSDLVHRSTHAMGTSVRVSLPKPVFTTPLVESSFDALRRIDTLLSAHDPRSILMQMNARPGVWATHPDLLAVARTSVELSLQSAGALDVTVLPAMRRLGFLPGSVSDLDRIDFTRLEVRKDRVRIRERGYGADFGGIAKGYGVDKAVEALRLQGVDAALVDAGGDLYALGRPHPERRWTIGIQHPGNEHHLAATLELENEAAATSGTYVQRRLVQGKEVSHLIHPTTGQPVHHVVSATIIARNTMLADGLATATSIMEPREAQALVEATEGAEGFWVYVDGTHFMSRGLRSRLRLM